MSVHFCVVIAQHLKLELYKEMRVTLAHSSEAEKSKLGHVHLGNVHVGYVHLGHVHLWHVSSHAMRWCVGS